MVRKTTEKLKSNLLELEITTAVFVQYGGPKKTPYVQYIKCLFYIQVWDISLIQRSLTSFSLLVNSIVVCVVFAVY